MLVMIACLFIMKLKIDQKIDYPLLSVRGARILMIVKIFGSVNICRQVSWRKCQNF